MQYQSEKSWAMTNVLATCAVVAVCAVATGAAVSTAATTSLYAPAAVQTRPVTRAAAAYPVAQRMQMRAAAQAPMAAEQADFQEVEMAPVVQQAQGLSAVQGLLISASALVAGLAAYLFKSRQVQTQWAMAAETAEAEAKAEESTAIVGKSYKSTTPAESFYGKPVEGSSGKMADPMKSTYKPPVGGYSASNNKDYVPTTDRSASFYSKSSGAQTAMPTYSPPVGGYSADNGKTYKPTTVKASSYFGADQGAAPYVRGAMHYGPDRPKWLGTLTSDSSVPAYLDGTLPGDYGFDPLGLGANPAALERYREAEVIHGRWAMLGALGCAAPEVMAKYYGYESPEPVWFKAGEYIFNHTGVDATLAGNMQSIFGHANSGNQIALNPAFIFVCHIIFMGLGEGFRASQITGRDKVYPGKFFDPLLLADGPDAARDQKVKEIKNGRLAMMAMLGFFVQGFITREGPIANLADHLAAPASVNIFSNIH